MRVQNTLVNVLRTLKFSFLPLAFLFIVFNSGVVLSQPSNIQLSVPDTQVEFEGLAAPNSLVVVSQNSTPITSVLADLNGQFKTQFLSSQGIKQYELYYEVNQVQSVVIRKTFSITSQQLNSFQINLPPILIGPINNVNFSDSITLNGISASNQIIRLIAGNGIILETTSNNLGSFTFRIAASQFDVGSTSFIAYLLHSSGLSDSSNVVSVDVLQNPVQDNESSDLTGSIPPDLVRNPNQPPRPTVTFPADSYYFVEDSDTIEFRGFARPNDQVVMYINGVVSGSVFADSNGQWKISYRSDTTSILVQFQSCLDNSCSLTTETFKVEFGLIVGVCSTDFSLAEFRFWNSTGAIKLQPISPDITEGVLEINWGDGSYEKFNYSPGSSIKHSYSERGYYNGKIIYTYSDDCSLEQYFSAHVIASNTTDRNTQIVAFVSLFLALTGLVLIAYFKRSGN